MVDLGINGLISGLDTNSIIDTLVTAERAPITRLQDRRSAHANRIQALQNLSARLLSLQVSTGVLGQSATVSGRDVSVSDESILQATVANSAAAGSYNIKVEQLAKAQQFSSGAFADQNAALNLSGEFLVNGRRISVESTDSLTDVARQINSVFAGVTASAIRVADGDYRLLVSSNTTGEGAVDLRAVGGTSILDGLTLTSGSAGLRNPISNGAASGSFASDTDPVAEQLNLSTAGAGTFQIDDGNGNVISVAIDLSTQSLSGIAAAINDAVAAYNAGSPPTPTQVSAAVTGSAGSFQLEISNGAGGSVSFTDDNHVLETLGVLSPAVAHEDQAGQNSLIRLNNIQIERTSNLISDVIGGVTLSLADDSKPAQTVQVTVTENTGVASDALQSFVSAFNAVRDFISANSDYNTDTREAGIFLGDFTVQGIESELFRQVGRRVNAAIGNSLASLNDGGGVDQGSLVITNRAGTSATVDLTGAATLGDVINAINRTSDLEVTASLNDAGTGLQLVDASGGLGSLKVEESGGTTAADLGLLGSTSGNKLSGGAITEARYISLTDIGVSLTSTGTLTFDSAKLATATNADPEAVRLLLSQSTVGVGASFTASLQRMTGTLSGTLKVRTDAIQSTIDDIDKTISRYEERVQNYEDRLIRQFSEMEKALAGFTRTSDFLAGQLSGLNNLRG